jgi:hypothetical protein
MTGVGEYSINGVYNSVIIACVWCEIEGLVEVASVNDGALRQHANIVAIVLLLLTTIVMDIRIPILIILHMHIIMFSDYS